MCRIAGIFDPNSNTLQEDILKMRDAMHRGGPDDAGVYVDGALALGHRRLSLIDLSADGHQPMLSNDERFVLVYNGEVYNFEEIREQLLALGYTFKSKSDTEVILYGFKHWGNVLFEKLNGMFALAIYDTQEKQITLARDYAGIKPLYYYLEEGKLYFASEIRAFKALNRFEENPDWQIYFLAFGHLPEPITTLQGVKPLPKGMVLTYKIEEARIQSPESRSVAGEMENLDVSQNSLDSGLWTLDSFSNFQFTHTITNKEEALAKVKETLTAAVKRHLISDAPIGLFLSGGIDSSLLTILAEPILKDKLQTLSIVFDETEFSEKAYQDIIIAQTGTKHRTYTVTKEQFQEALPDVMEAMDQPSTDGINSYFICKYAKEAGLTAVLSGLGADELFGGYNSFANMAKYELLRKWVPSIAFKSAVLFKKDKYQKASFLAIPGPIGQYLFNRGLLCPKEISTILSVDESKVWTLLTNLNQHYKYIDNATLRPGNSENKSQSLDSGFWTQDSYNKASFIESNLYMQNQLLKDSDYMSMWHSIEIRVPFLDKELIELAYQISPEIKAFEGPKKYLLIHALGSLLPRAIWDRPKMGFIFPFQKWLSNKNQDESALAIAKEEARGENFYAEKKFLKGEYTWSRYWATKLLKMNDIRK
jgi:asparagine synthase (glutamine-hydrolysing)